MAGPEDAPLAHPDEPEPEPEPEPTIPVPFVGGPEHEAIVDAIRRENERVRRRLQLLRAT